MDRIDVRNRAGDEAIQRAEQQISERQGERQAEEWRREERFDAAVRDDGVGRREAPISGRPEAYERPGSRLDITV